MPRYRKNWLYLIGVLWGICDSPFGQSKYCQYLINHQGILKLIRKPQKYQNLELELGTAHTVNINGVRGKILELLVFLEAHQPHVVAIQETKIDSIITISELFPEPFVYNEYRKDRNTHSGGMMLLIHRDISHMPITDLENNSESVWVKKYSQINLLIV